MKKKVQPNEKLETETFAMNEKKKRFEFVICQMALQPYSFCVEYVGLNRLKKERKKN